MDERPRRDDTSFHARRAAEGDGASLDWLVRRLSPFLYAQAQVRMGEGLRRAHDPDDVVADVWATTLPKLRDLAPSAGGHARTLVKYLSTVLLHRILDLAKTRARRLRKSGPAEDAAWSSLPAETSGVVTRAAREERRSLLTEALARLEPDDRAVIVHRGVEQLPTAEVAALLGVSAGAVAVRYHRALKKLKEELPTAVIDDLAES